MEKKSTLLINLSEKLLKLAPVMGSNTSTACFGLVGEPKLPKKLKIK